VKVCFFFWAEDELALYLQGMEGKGKLPKNRLVRGGVRICAQDKANVKKKRIAGVLFRWVDTGGNGCVRGNVERAGER